MFEFEEGNCYYSTASWLFVMGYSN